MAGEECWLREGSELQLFRVSNIGVIVCAKSLSHDICIAHSCGSSSPGASQVDLRVGQVHPPKKKTGLLDVCHCLLSV